MLSRAQGGRMTVEVEPVLVDRLIHDAVAEESTRYPLVRFEIETEGRLPPVDGDMTYLGQVLRNMIGNAGKYGPKPGVVRVRAFAADGWVSVAVLDDGPGFDPEEASKLFEIFFRSARTAGIPGRIGHRPVCGAYTGGSHGWQRSGRDCGTRAARSSASRCPSST